MTNPRIVLVGAVWSTEIALRGLADAGCPPVLLITLPLQKSHWHSDFVDLEPIAQSIGVRTLRVDDVNSADVIAAMTELQPDLVMVIGWSRLCGAEFLAVPGLGAVGYHPTLLPKMRGRAALAWTIILDVRKSGGSLFWIDDGVDSGPIAIQRSFELGGRETLPDLIELQKQALADMIPALIEQLSRGEKPATVQDHSQATYLAVRRPADGEIDWSRPADEIERLVRSASRPYPGAFTYLKGRKLLVLSAKTADYSNWQAQIGQVFTYEDGAPVVRCGGGTDLLITELEFAQARDPSTPASTITGQPRLGLRK